MNKQGIYAYGVVDSPQVKMDDYFTSSYKSLTLIGKMIEISDFQKELQEALKNPKTMELVLTKHQDFLDRLIKKTTVVPFQFGTIFKGKEGAVDHLKSSYVKYKELLKKFKDKQEWGIRVFADLKKVKVNISSNSKSREKLGMGTAYLLRKKQEEEAEKATDEKLTSFSEEILNGLKELAFEYEVTKSAQRFSEKDELLVSVFTFLLPKPKVKKFNQKLTSLQKKYQKFGLRLISSGPWPAYSFVS